MRRPFVADASVAVGWVHPAQATALTAGMLDAIAKGATIEVPAPWPLEVANALTVLARRGKLTEDERHTGLGWLHGLPLASTMRWRHWRFRGCQIWRPLTSCRSMTPRISSWHRHENSGWAARSRVPYPLSVPHYYARELRSLTAWLAELYPIENEKVRIVAFHDLGPIGWLSR